MHKLFLLFLVFTSQIFSKGLAPENYWDVQSISNPKINNSGDYVIFSKRYIDKKNDSFESEIWIMDVNGEGKRFFSKGTNYEWSYDGTKVAYLKKDQNDVNQIFVKQLEGGSETKITNFDNDIEDFAWSRKDDFFAFSSFNEYEDDWVVEVPGEKKGEDYNWTDDPKVVTTLHWRYDGQGELESGENHLYIVSTSGGSAAKVSDWGLDFTGDLQWDFDGNLIFTGNNTLNDLETPWKQSAVFTLNTESGDLKKISPEGVFSTPKLSLDGKSIAFTGYPSKDFSSVAYDVYLYLDGFVERYTENLSDSPENLFWLSKNELAFQIDERGSSKVKILNIVNKSLREAIRGFNEQFYLSSAFDSELFGTYATASRPAEIATISSGKISKLSNFNEVVLGQFNLGETFEINYSAPDGTDVQGWYILPPEFDDSKKYPLILIIHGGPHAMYRPQFNYLWHQFASDGYIVLFTNPRGSTGYGSDFANVIDNDYPGPGDLSDLLAGVDYVTNLGIVDERNMFVQGCSGGGVLTAWVVGHDDRFAAAASLCPVTNWISMVGTTDIPAWTFDWFDVPFWEDPKDWLDRSPIMRTGYIKTPTLFMTGVLDIRTPMPQTEEMYVALKEAGVDTVLVRMNGEWHGTGRRKPTNWFRTYGYLSEWYERYTE